MKLDRELLTRMGSKRAFSLPALIAGLILLTFSLSLFIAPATLPPGSIDLGESGTNLPDEKRNITKDMPSFQRAIYNLGDASCHQKASRSFFINGNQMPLCSRCIAIYLGLAIGVLIMAFLYFDPELWMFLVGLGPMAVDGGGQTILGLWESTNLIRVATGLPAGIVSGIALGYIISTVYFDVKAWRAEKRMERSYSKKP